jgi:3-isopropylmalate dehydrogenase
MSANAAFHIAVLPGDGIGHEVMAPALEVLRRVAETTPSLKFRFSEAPAGAEEYKATGKSMSEKTVKLCEEADAIFLGACGLPSVRYPDNTEIMPQVELRFIFDLYAGMRPARLIPGVPSPIVGAAERGIDFVLIRESTEGLFASMGKGVTTHDEARETLVVTRKTTERLFDFSLKLTERRKKRGRPGRLTLVDKANVFKAFNWQRDIFNERKAKVPGVKTDMLYVDACAAMMVKKPWDFDVMVMENMFGDILSDLAAGLIGGLGIAPSADIGDKHAVFQPCHGTAPDIMGQGKANPTAMILSAAMMLDWLADRHDHPPAADAAQRIERAVDKAYAGGIKPMEYGGKDGTAAIAAAVMQALG